MVFSIKNDDYAPKVYLSPKESVLPVHQQRVSNIFIFFIN